VDPATRMATINFRPFRSIITITKLTADGDVSEFDLTVTDRQIEIPDGMYHQKAVFQTTYAVAEPDVDIISNIASEENKFINAGTTDGAFLELPGSPYIEPGIINDNTDWKRISSMRGEWQYILPGINDAKGVTGWIDQGSLGKAFPIDGAIHDNVYYGRAGETPIFRTDALEAHLYNIMSDYSGDVTIRVERFFAKYTGQVMEENLIYEPIQVRVNNLKAQNLSSYDGSPDAGFVAQLSNTQQYRHFSNRIQFPDTVGPNSTIEVIYQTRASTVQYKAKLLCNKKSRFYTSPLLKRALLVTSL